MDLPPEVLELLADAEHSQRTSYACGKLMTEFFMKDAVDAGQIRGCSIRFANVYSKNELYAKHILPHIAESLLRDGSVTLLDNSKRNKRTFLHNYDSCASVLALLDDEVLPVAYSDMVADRFTAGHPVLARGMHEVACATELLDVLRAKRDAATLDDLIGTLSPGNSSGR